MAKTADEILSRIDQKLDEVSTSLYKVDKDVALQKAAFDEHIRQDEKMYEELKRMNDILQQNTESLKEHMQRTELLEEMVKKMDSRLSPVEIRHIEQEAIKKHRKEMLVLWAKVAGALTAIVGIAAALKPVLVILVNNL